MDTPRQQVHIGPISLFTLVAALGMAVLAVLSVSTSNAMYTLAKRAALMTSETYEADVCGQRLLAELDGVLQDARSQDADVYGAVSGKLPTIVSAAQQEADPFSLAADDEAVEVTASLIERELVAAIKTPAGCRIDLKVAISEDGTYEVMEWKATTDPEVSTTVETLWSPEG